MSYTMILFRHGRLKPGGYEGCVTGLRSTSPGGGQSRCYISLDALGKGVSTRMYDFIRQNPGTLAIYLNTRINVRDVTQRSALVQAARTATQYISEVSPALSFLALLITTDKESVGHEWLGSFASDSPLSSDAAHLQWWPTTAYKGHNAQTPAKQAVRGISPLSLADRLKNARLAAKAK